MIDPRYEKSAYSWEKMTGYMWTEEGTLILEHGYPGDCVERPDDDYIRLELTKRDLREIISRAKRFLK